MEKKNSVRTCIWKEIVELFFSSKRNLGANIKLAENNEIIDGDAKTGNTFDIFFRHVV